MSNNISIDLIIDGNYVLNKNVFTLHKNNLLYGALNRSLENVVNNYRKWHPFTNVYLVSDSKEKSWRKDLSVEYKATRKKDSDIDWQFVFGAYGEFKNLMSRTIQIMEAPRIEGDDWIAFLVDKANREGRSTLIVSNDYDIKPIGKYGVDPHWINIMTNEMYNKEKLFLPKNYQIFLNKISKLPNDDIFELNENTEFLGLMDRFIHRSEIHELDSNEAWTLKVISGAQSDNISSAWSVIKNGKKRGIGSKGAQSVYDNYLTEFGELNLQDPDAFENIADLICEKKNLSKTSIEKIVENIKCNMKLIDLRMENLPPEIINTMQSIYEQHR